ncbi:MAG TPA: YfiR family protein [Methylomirabilota bacterium]|nr:YfiR family protein [Methylomirabilota bacterium]
MSESLKRLSRIRFVFFILLFSGGLDLAAQTEISKEYQVKAVFLFNFAQFVEWPTNSFSDAQVPLTIGVLGDDPFGDFLDATVRGEKVGGHPLVVQRFRRVEDVKDCRILFISRSESRQMKRILADLKQQKMLTVSDVESFSESGGVIGFVTVQNKIRFKINLDAGKNANLAFSSKLLRLAEIVGSGKN